MKRKLIGIVLVLTLTLSLPGGTLAAEGDVRQTGFFAEVPHARTDYADMKYKHIEPGPILALIDQARELLDDASNASRVEELYEQISGDYLEMNTMLSLTQVRSNRDIWDKEAAEEYAWCTEQDDLVNDAIRALVRDILNSPCAAFLEKRLGPEGVDKYEQYEDMTDRQRELRAREIALVSEYYGLAGQTFAAEYDGREWDSDSLNAAFRAGEIDQKTYDATKNALMVPQNKTLGPFYLELAAVRRELAEAYGYDSCAGYACENEFNRDYTPEEIQSFQAAVKEYIAPLSAELRELRNAYRQVDEYKALLDDGYVAYAGDPSLDMMEPYVGRLSGEVLESFEYLRRYHLYDIGPSDTKADEGYTITLPQYGAAFIFDSPYGDIRDFQTAVHEFGHYNKFYHIGWSWERNDAGDSYDAMEVHSQGLEALFFHFYPEIFGELAPAAEINQMYNLVRAIVQGALHDEFQQYVYAADGGLTLETLNGKYRELCAEYGILGDDGLLLDYDWVEISHTFTEPCYYISYATSAAGALAVWEESQNDFYGAEDKYLAFTALEPSMGFVERFATVGMDSPIDPAFIKTLSEMLSERLDLGGRRSELSKAGDTISRAALAQMLYDRAGESAVTAAATFADVSPNASYADAAAWAGERGYILATATGPSAPTTRSRGSRWRSSSIATPGPPGRRLT